MPKPVLPKASQRHIALVIDTILRSEPLPSTIRILDIGCGDGRLLAYLAQTLPGQNTNRNFEFFGFEVGDLGWHASDYLASTTSYLNEHAPGYSWKDTIACFGTSDPWPCTDQSFHIIVSNQVFEHVQDHPFVFREIRRCLAPKGVSIHMFPVREVLWECHAHMPLVHKIRNPRRREQWMLFFARLGFTYKYKDELSLHGWKTLPEFALKYSDILGRFTNYLPSARLAELAERAGLSAAFSYTKNFYSTKLLSVLKRGSGPYRKPTWVDRVAFPLLKRLSSITLILRSDQTA